MVNYLGNFYGLNALIVFGILGISILFSLNMTPDNKSSNFQLGIHE
jgi:hypothetical protein